MSSHDQTELQDNVTTKISGLIFKTILFFELVISFKFTEII